MEKQASSRKTNRLLREALDRMEGVIADLKEVCDLLEEIADCTVMQIADDEESEDEDDSQDEDDEDDDLDGDLDPGPVPDSRMPDREPS